MTETPHRAVRAPALRPLDIAYGIPLGLDRVAPLERSRAPVAPLVAFEAVLAEALARPPCMISFSGGRDSSALLAAAARIARRENLDLPIPATLVFPGAGDSNEDGWQSFVLRHLKITDWLRFEFTDELDAVGPVATRALLRHGLLWPFNTHFHLPIIERASGGTVVTGFGGDELGLSLFAANAERLLTSRRRLRWRDLLVIGLALSPRPVKALVYRRRSRADIGELPWLTSAGARQLANAYGAEEGRMPLGWEAKLRRTIWCGRYFRICRDSFSALGAYHDVAVFHPFVDGRVLDALGQAGGFGGMGDRTGLMRRVFGDLLPAELIERRTKGGFTDPLWTDTAKRFAKEWSGGGVDPSLVDPEALRRHWAGETRNLVSTTLLQAAWLHDHAGAARDISA